MPKDVSINSEKGNFTGRADIWINDKKNVGE